MEAQQKNNSIFSKIRHRIARTGDSEPEQAILRLAIGTLIFVYFCLPWQADEHFAEIFDSKSNIIITIATSIAFLIFAAIVKNPVTSPLRRIIGIVLDMTSLSILLYWTAGDHIPLFVFYLWVILGNGFRYGTVYLYISYGVSLAGFSSVIIWSQYWQQHQSFAISLLIILVALPLYAAFLLKKLHAAIASAKQANDAKSQFLANMSHELRTPLNGVIGMGELLRETNLNYEQQELVSTMHSSADTLLELIENILDISKIEAGKVVAESKDFDLHILVNTVLLMMAPLGEKKGLRVSCYFDPETPFELIGDQRYIHQVLVNLINNAIKFTQEGAVALSVKIVAGSRMNPVIRFEITDTGIGIEEEAIDRIFENFTQADASTSRVFGGTGLGTTISKELVELMGGIIGVESQKDHGSMFWFEIPFIGSNDTQPSISENRILLLASEDTASVIRPSLKNWNVEFDWIRTSTRALTQLLQASDDEHPYETVIVDQSSLTDIDAVQFARLVKSEDLLDSTTLVLINSSDTMMDANRINQFYISTIEHPEDKRLLFNAIHAALSVNLSDPTIVSMAEHYTRQSGAKALNILVAEDNLVNQKVIQGILQNAGHNVRLANTGEQALDIIDEDLDSIELIILDMNMPEVSGIEVIKTLRFLDTNSRIPTIMLTADATPEAREACISAGANKFLTKPIDTLRLLECVASLSRHIRTSNPKKTVQIERRKVKRHVNSNFIESEWYDRIVLDELDTLGGDPEFIASLVRNFIEEGTKHVQTIKASIDEDYLVYRESLHALKGSSTELGAKHLVDICLKGEALKPYDLGSDKIYQHCLILEDIFNNTATALEHAVTVYQKQLPTRLKDH